MKKLLKVCMAALLIIATGLTLLFIPSGTTTKAEAATGLKVQYQCGVATSTVSALRPYLCIVNESSSSVPLSSLKIRYWYTKEGTQSENFAVDYQGSLRSKSYITGTFGDAPNGHYLEIGFTSNAGSLPPGTNTGRMKFRVYKSDWSNYDQTNDYSFDPTKTSALADWTKVTLYQNGVLIWGTEPGGSSTPTTTPTPTGGIDFNIWKLQQPDGSTIEPSQLVAGYSSPYFYKASDGGQIFMCPQTGVTTSGSRHPRCELREVTSSGSNAAWSWTGTNTLTVTGKIIQLGGGTSGRTAIGQIFNATDSIPLCELMYEQKTNSKGGNFKVLYEEAKGAGTYIDLPTSCAIGQTFTYKLELSGGKLYVYINGNLVYSRTPSFSGKLFYFKCGNYDQTAVAGPVSTKPYTIVELYSIDVVHK